MSESETSTTSSDSELENGSSSDSSESDFDSENSDSENFSDSDEELCSDDDDSDRANEDGGDEGVDGGVYEEYEDPIEGFGLGLGQNFWTKQRKDLFADTLRQAVRSGISVPPSMSLLLLGSNCDQSSVETSDSTKSENEAVTVNEQDKYYHFLSTTMLDMPESEPQPGSSEPTEKHKPQASNSWGQSTNYDERRIFEELERKKERDEKHQKLNEKFDKEVEEEAVKVGNENLKRLLEDSKWIQDRIPITIALAKYLDEFHLNLTKHTDEFYCSKDLSCKYKSTKAKPKAKPASSQSPTSENSNNPKREQVPKRKENSTSKSSNFTDSRDSSSSLNHSTVQSSTNDQPSVAASTSSTKFDEQIKNPNSRYSEREEATEVTVKLTRKRKMLESQQTQGHVSIERDNLESDEAGPSSSNKRSKPNSISEVTSSINPLSHIAADIKSVMERERRRESTLETNIKTSTKSTSDVAMEVSDNEDDIQVIHENVIHNKPNTKNPKKKPSSFSDESDAATAFRKQFEKVKCQMEAKSKVVAEERGMSVKSLMELMNVIDVDEILVKNRLPSTKHDVL